MVKYHLALLLGNLLLLQNRIPTVFLKVECWGHLHVMHSGFTGSLLNKQSSQVSCSTTFCEISPMIFQSPILFQWHVSSKTPSVSTGAGGERIWKVGSALPWVISVGVGAWLSAWGHPSPWDLNDESQSSLLISSKWSCTWSFLCLNYPRGIWNVPSLLPDVPWGLSEPWKSTYGVSLSMCSLSSCSQF